MEAKAIDLSKSKRPIQFRVGSVVIVLTIIALAISTFVGTTATAKNETVQNAAGARLLAANNTENPGIDVDCEKPVLTVAIQIDRSGSVWGQQNTYINTVRTFVNDLYNKFVLSGGEVRLIVFAFGTRSVIQNDTTGPSQQLVVSMNDSSSRDSLLNVISNVHFENNPNGNDYFSRSNTGKDNARGYNPGRQGSTFYGYTNYDDALLDIARVASTPYFNNDEIGRHIDLALFLTDGAPNIHNRGNRAFEVADVAAGFNADGSWNSSYTSQGRIYARDTVSALRSGKAVAGLPARPPMDVKAVLIAASTESATKQVFGDGPDNFLYASNFGSELNKQLDEIVNTLTEGYCALEVVTPSISVEVNPGNITITEEQTRTYTITVRNTSPVPVTNLVVTINGVYFTTIPNLGPAGDPDGVVTRSNSISLPLGGNLPGALNIQVTGTATPTSSQRFADDSSEKVVTGGDSVNVSYTRIALPA